MMPTAAIQKKAEPAAAASHHKISAAVFTADLATPIETPVIQRKSSCACGGGCPQCQTNASGALPSSLNISQPTDPLEKEADHVAEQVMQAPVVSPPAAQQQAPRSIPYRFGASQENRVSQKSMPGERQSSSRNPGSHHGFLQSGGHPMPIDQRQYFEPRFGADLSQVRLHTNADADLKARSINAKAFTIGRHIAFRSTEYQPSSYPGKLLLAHELTHVLQNGQNYSYEPVINRQLWGPSTHQIPMEELDYFQRMNEALAYALPAFGYELALCIAMLLLSLVVAIAVFSVLLGWLEGALPAVFAFVESALMLGGGVMGAIAGIRGVVGAREAWIEFDEAIRTAGNHHDLEVAGERFGSAMAQAVAHFIEAALMFYGARAGVKALRTRRINPRGWRGSSSGGGGSTTPGSGGTTPATATGTPGSVSVSTGTTAGAAVTAESPILRTIINVIEMVSSGRRIPRARLVELATRIKQAIHLEAAGSEGELAVGAYCVEGYCGQAGRMIRALLQTLGLASEEGMAARMVHVEGEGGGGVHGLVAGRTAEGEFFIFDPTVEQFTTLPRVFEGGVSTANPEFLAASEEAGSFISALQGDEGLAFFRSRQAFQQALQMYLRLAEGARLRILEGAGRDLD